MQALTPSERKAQVEEIELILGCRQSLFMCGGPPLCIHWPNGRVSTQEKVTIEGITLISRLECDTSTQVDDFFISTDDFVFHVRRTNDEYLDRPKCVTFKDGTTVHTQDHNCQLCKRETQDGQP